MQMIRCENGHYFDSAKHYSCPYCAVSANNNLQKTRAMFESSPDLAKTQPLYKENQEKGETKKDEKGTIGILSKAKGIDPVVGWLVCIEGPEKGRDYRIRSEKNFVGRAEKMDVRIVEDETVSRENHAVVSYDPKKNTFRIYPGDSKGLTYLNNDEVVLPTELKQGDIIELGQTKLMFIPFCNESFQW